MAKKAGKDRDGDQIDKHPPGSPESGSGASKKAKQGDENQGTADSTSGTTKQNERKPTGSGADDSEED